ncbi:MAG: S8 family serine peptidase [Thermoanaerobaculia bacterium]
MRRPSALLLVFALAAPAFAEPPKRVAPEILVGFNDRVSECAEARFRLDGALHRSSLDSLFRRFGVSDVRAVFRTAENRPVPVAELRRREEETARQVREAFPERERRGGNLLKTAGAAPGLFHVYRLTLAPDADVEAAVAAFRQDPHVALAEPNSLMSIQALPDDTFADPDRDGSWSEASWDQPYADLWGLARTGWAEVWERQAEIWPDAGRVGGGGITVAVIDTGVDYRHPDLAANVWRDSKQRPGRDFVDIQLSIYVRHGYVPIPGEDYRGRDFDPSDRSGHGTHVAGTIAAVAGNGAGIAGVAWKARLMPLRVGFTIRTPGGDAAGLLELDDIAAALVYAADQGADVVNMSFGATGEEPLLLRKALQYAHDHGVVLVASAGNEGSDAARSYPASDPDVICVGAAVSSDRRIHFSNWGGRVDLAAPGSDILSLRAAGTALTGAGNLAGEDQLYIRASGTSMAAPHVAGAAALLLSRHPDLTPAAVLARLASSAAPTGETTVRDGRTYPFGAGRLDLPRALEVEAEPAILLHSFEVVDDGAGGDGDGVPESGERVRVRVSLRNAGRTLEQATAELEAVAPWVLVRGSSLFAGLWRAGEVRTFGTELEIPAGTPRNLEGALRVAVHSSLLHREIPLPLVVNGPADLRGWPVKGLKVADGLVTSPALGDLDGDGRPEVVAMTTQGDVFVRGADGRPLPGWPVRLRGSHEQSSPLVTDLDGDGDSEVVIAMNREIQVLDGTGRPLPGWPQPTAHLVLCSPAAGDVDGDGRLEVVVVDEEAHLYVFDAGGHLLPGWPRDAGSFSNTTPVLADLDGEPGAEILAGTTDGWLVAFGKDGHVAPGSWPALLGTLGPSSPAVADLDGDGEVEIVAVNAGGTLFLLDRKGAIETIARLPGLYSFSSPAVGDLDGDGRAEIAIGSGQADGAGFVSLFDAAGTMKPGWPVATGGDVSASPALVDLDADGHREVVVPDLSGQLHALRANGRAFPGWPRDLDGWVLSSPVAADLDGDGGLEVVLGRIVLGVLRTPIAMTFAIETGSAAAAWPTFKGDPRRTGSVP